MQEGQPITFFSKKFGLKLQAAFVYIKELHANDAITKAVLKWRQRQYLLRHFFVIRTNHKSIRELLHQVIQTPDQKVYVRKLLGFQFRIEYKPGNSNKVADALLSRVPSAWHGEYETPCAAFQALGYLNNFKKGPNIICLTNSIMIDFFFLGINMTLNEN
jgi:hypothetical protein